MKFKNICFATVALGIYCTSATLTSASVAYLRSEDGGAPWGLTGNEEQMDNVFGAGNWSDLRFETVSPAALFSSGTSFVFLEGGDAGAEELQTFLTANSATIGSWVSAGGRLLVNSAPNEGGLTDLGFGVTLTYSDFSFSGSAVNAAHPVFNGPAVPVSIAFTGDYLSHASVSGAGLSGIIVDDNGDMILAEKSVGSGHVVFGGLTLPFFTSHPLWLPQPEASNLHQNIIAYSANPVPEPSTYLAGALLLVIFGVHRLRSSPRQAA